MQRKSVRTGIVTNLHISLPAERPLHLKCFGRRKCCWDHACDLQSQGPSHRLNSLFLPGKQGRKRDMQSEAAARSMLGLHHY